MLKDPTKFRKRFQRWKEGLPAYRNGRAVDDEEDFESFRQTLPDNQKPIGGYRTKRYWELNGKPKTFGEAIGQGMYSLGESGIKGQYGIEIPAWHANSVMYNEATGNYEFMKPNNHDTRWMEDVYGYWSPDNKDFRENYKLQKGVVYDKYVPKKNVYELPKFEGGKDGEHKSISFLDAIRYNTKELERKLEVNNYINSQKENLPPATEDTTPKYKITDIFNPVAFAIKTARKLINKIVYDAYSGSGGQPNIPAILEGGSKYTGSYIYPARSSYKTGRLQPDQSEDNKNLGSSSEYGGDNADITRDLVALNLGRPANVKKLRHGTYNVGDIQHTGFVYEGKIYPKTFAGDTYLIPKQVKPQFDNLIQNDRSYLVDMNQLPVDRSRYPLQTIDNVRHARLKPQKDSSGNYLLKATKLWDMSSPNIGILGDVADFFTKLSGGNKFVLEQTIPVQFVDSVDTRDWHTIRNTFVNPNKKQKQ